MRKIFVSAILRTVLFLSCLDVLQGQTNSITCGFQPTSQNVQYLQYLKTQIPLGQPLSTSPNQYIPLYFWIILNDAGQGTSPTDAQIDAMLDGINPLFNFPNNLKFKRCGSKTINSTNYSNLNTSKHEALNNAYFNCNAINIYITQSTSDGLWGYSPSVFDSPTAPLVNMVVITPFEITVPIRYANVAHELGHTFGLLHTHQFAHIPSLREQFARTPISCEQKGDFMCDTPADYGYDGSYKTNPPSFQANCTNFGVSDCNTSPPCLVVDDSGTPLQPDYRNIMSYYGISCQNHFSGEQQLTMNVALQGPSRAFLLRSTEGVVANHCNTPTTFALNNINIDISVGYNSGADPQYIKTCQPYREVSNTTGSYYTCALNPGVNTTGNPGNYQQIATAVPTTTASYFTGVTTFDIALLSKHNIQLQLLDNPYKILAGDVDNSGGLDAVDELHIRRLILRYTTIFPNGVGSWRFVPKYYTANTSFLNSFNADPFSAVYTEGTQSFPYLGTNSYMNRVNLNLSNTNILATNNWSFAAMKMGDLNCSAGGTTARIFKPTHTYTNVNNKSISLKVGEEKTILLKAKYDGNINNFQVGFKFTSSKIDVTAIEKGDFNSANDIMEYSKFDNGELRALWYDKKAKNKSFKNDVTIMKIKVKAKTPITDLISELKLDPETLESEFYDETSQLVGVALTLESNGGVTAIDNSNYSVTAFPNPFTSALTFDITSATRENATLTISNSLGLPIYTVKQQLEIGTNTIQVNNTSGFPSGVLSYSIKMISTTLTGTVNKSR